MKRATKAFLYGVFLLLTFELSCRLFLSIPFIAKRPITNEDISWRRVWVYRHPHLSETQMHYPSEMYDASKGWISKPNLRDMQVYNNKILNTNSKGLRGKTEYAYGEHPNKVRILILGDSFTFGDEVSDHETYSSYLQEMLPHIEVINMGVNGYGHDQMLILFKEEGIKYKPDIVILGFLPKDMSRNLLQFRDYAKPKFAVARGELKLIGSPVPRPEDILKWDWARPRIYDIVSIFRNEYRNYTGLKKKEKEHLTTHLLNEMIAVADRIHAVPIFVYLPAGKEITSRIPLTQGENFLFSWCQTHAAVRCFSARPDFAKETAKGTRFKLRRHWGPAGHRVVAQAIKRYLVDEEYLVRPESTQNSDVVQPNATTNANMRQGT